MKWFIIIVLIIIAGALSYFSFLKPKTIIEVNNNSTPQATSSMETVNLTTEDGVNIIADWSLVSATSDQGPEIKTAVLLLHMMPVDRKSWTSLTEKLNTAGFATLAIDLRGHGESTKSASGLLDYKKFTDAEHQASRLDVIAAVNFLKEKGFEKRNIALIGASIGANLALDYLGRNEEIKTAVLLSPGLDYRGLVTQPIIGKLTPNQSVFMAVSEEDSYSFNSSKILAQATKIKKELKLFKDAGHGTAMFSKEPQLEQEIVDWLKQIYK